MEIHGNPWKSMEIHGIPWKSMEIDGIPRNPHGVSMEYPWSSMELHFHGNLLIRNFKRLRNFPEISYKFQVET